MHIVNVGYRSTNYYVLADSRPRLLVDLGWSGTLGTITQTCARKGIQLQDIPYQLATHYHIDHAGLAQDLKQIGIRLIVLDTQVASIPLMRQHTKPRDNYTEITTENNLVITAAASRAFLQTIGLSGEIIPTPGHSDDSISLILDEHLAFTGDLTNPALLPPDLDDPARASWETLRAHGVTTIYPGHGPVWNL